MKAATAVLRHEHEAIVLALRILAEIDRHAIAHDPVHLEELRALVDFLLNSPTPATTARKNSCCLRSSPKPTRCKHGLWWSGCWSSTNRAGT